MSFIKDMPNIQKQKFSLSAGDNDNIVRRDRTVQLKHTKLIVIIPSY